MQRPGGPDADEVAVRVGEVVDLGAEARSRHHPGDPVCLEPLDLALDLVGRELEPNGAADLPPAVGIPREDEEGLLLEDTKPEHLEQSVEALDRLASKTLARLGT